MECDSPITKFKSPPTPSSQVDLVVSILAPDADTTAALIEVSKRLEQISWKNDTKKGKAATPTKRRSSSVTRPMPPNSPVVPGSPVRVPGQMPSVRQLLSRKHFPVRPMSSTSQTLDAALRFILSGKVLPKGFLVPATTKASSKELAYLRKKRICVTGCPYPVFATVALSIGLELCSESDLWNIRWSDAPLYHDKIMMMRRLQDLYAVFWGAHAPIQKWNHFPGMHQLWRKDCLSRNLNKLKRLHPLDYNFFPETFDLPTESAELLAFARRRRKRNLTFIVKPGCDSRGRGIFLVKDLNKLEASTQCVCQLYLPRPFLIDGYKFDCRIYVLITSVEPLRIYIYEEGIARFATVKYKVPNKKNMEVTYMHLTNYSINKFSESYIKEADGGSKRTLSAVYAWMAAKGHDVGQLLQRIDEIIIKTILAAGPSLVHDYRICFPKRDRGCSCFELLGFDIIIDRNLNPYLLEVNQSPSFNVELPVDHLVKEAVIADMFSMIYLGDRLPSRKNRKKRILGDVEAPSLEPIEDSEGGELLTVALRRQFRHEMKHRGKFRLIYCSSNLSRFQPLASDRYNNTSLPLVTFKSMGATLQPKTSTGKGDTIIYDPESVAVGLEKEGKTAEGLVAATPSRRRVVATEGVIAAEGVVAETPSRRRVVATGVLAAEGVASAEGEQIVVDSSETDQIIARDINNNYILDDFKDNRE